MYVLTGSLHMAHTVKRGYRIKNTDLAKKKPEFMGDNSINLSMIALIYL